MGCGDGGEGVRGRGTGPREVASTLRSQQMGPVRVWHCGAGRPTTGKDRDARDEGELVGFGGNEYFVPVRVSRVTSFHGSRGGLKSGIYHETGSLEPVRRIEPGGPALSPLSWEEKVGGGGRTICQVPSGTMFDTS